MSTKEKPWKLGPALLQAPVTAVTLAVTGTAFGQTIVPGGDVAGEWGPEEIRVADTVTVPPGQRLTVVPGTRVVFAPAVELVVDGTLEVDGTADEPVLFTSTGPSDRWAGVRIRYSSQSEDSQVRFGEVEYAVVGIRLVNASGSGAVLAPTIEASWFHDIDEAAIRAEAVGSISGFPQSPRNPRVDFRVARTRFERCGDGIVLHRSGARFVITTPPGGSLYAAGGLSPTIENCTFGEFSGAALLTSLGDYGTTTAGAGSEPTFVNNTIVDVGRGLLLLDPFDATITNNIVSTASTAMERNGSGSSTVTNNLLASNDINFVGFPTSYGTLLSGEDHDILDNLVGLDPLLLDDVHIASDSPAVDRGKEPAPDEDFDGDPRPHGAGIDIGADELPTASAGAGGAGGGVGAAGAGTAGALSHGGVIAGGAGEAGFTAAPTGGTSTSGGNTSNGGSSAGAGGAPASGGSNPGGTDQGTAGLGEEAGSGAGAPPATGGAPGGTMAVAGAGTGATGGATEAGGSTPRETGGDAAETGGSVSGGTPNELAGGAAGSTNSDGGDSDGCGCRIGKQQRTPLHWAFISACALALFRRPRRNVVG